MDALAIDELLRLVFQHCDHHDNFCNALVSKKWSQEALSALWSHLDTPYPLLTLLAPMVKKDIKYEFERPLWSHDWTVFQKYSWRVHRISFPSIGSTLYHHSIFTEIALTKPHGDLIPNLQNLVCQPYSLCDFIPLLLNRRLADLTITGISGTSLTKVKSLLSYLPERCPTLRRLDLRIFEYDYTEIGLEVLLAPLSSLTKLEIAPATLTPLVMHALSCLPRLEHVQSTHRWPTRNPNRLPRPPVDTSERFTSLRLLEISTDNVPPFLETYRLDNLRKLVLEADTQQTREQHLRFFEIISHSCPQLETLHLGNSSHDRPSELPLATWETFAPLRRLPRLADLSLVDLPMSTPTLLYLAENLPSLTRLDLRRSSTIDGTPAFPISVLPQLAVIRPQLVFLGLCMDTSVPAPAVAFEENERFRYLAELNVGPSRLDSPVLDVATYLSGILPEGCQLSRLFDGWSGDEGESWESWEPVIEMVSALNLDKKVSCQAAS
ncbi:F-box domain-containing protein [Pleurotus pulmonarius]